MPSADKTAPSKKMAVFINLLDFFQLLVFVLNSRFPWGSSIANLTEQLRNLQFQVSPAAPSHLTVLHSYR